MGGHFLSKWDGSGPIYSFIACNNRRAAIIVAGKVFSRRMKAIEFLIAVQNIPISSLAKINCPFRQSSESKIHSECEQPSKLRN